MTIHPIVVEIFQWVDFQTISHPWSHDASMAKNHVWHINIALHVGILCCRMLTSSLMVNWSPAGQNPSRAGRRPLSTAFIKETANLQSPKSSPRVERADTPSSVQPTLTGTQEGANCYPASWDGFLRRYKAVNRTPQLTRLRGPKESSTTSAISGHLRVTMQSLRWLFAPKPKALI